MRKLNQQIMEHQLKVERKSQAAIRLFNTIQQRLVAEEADLKYFEESARRFDPGSPQFQEEMRQYHQAKYQVINDILLLAIIKKKIALYLEEENPVKN